MCTLQGIARVISGLPFVCSLQPTTADILRGGALQFFSSSLRWSNALK